MKKFSEFINESNIGRVDNKVTDFTRYYKELYEEFYTTFSESMIATIEKAMKDTLGDDIQDVKVFKGDEFNYNEKFRNRSFINTFWIYTLSDGLEVWIHTNTTGQKITSWIEYNDKSLGFIGDKAKLNTFISSLKSTLKKVRKDFKK